MIVARIDGDGYFIDDVILDEKEHIPSDCIKTRPDTKNRGIYRPRWNGTEWMESMSQEEIDELNQPMELTENEILMLAVAELDMQREQDKIETQLAIAELAETLLGGGE